MTKCCKKHNPICCEDLLCPCDEKIVDKLIKSNDILKKALYKIANGQYCVKGCCDLDHPQDIATETLESLNEK